MKKVKLPRLHLPSSSLPRFRYLKLPQPRHHKRTLTVRAKRKADPCPFLAPAVYPSRRIGFLLLLLLGVAPLAHAQQVAGGLTLLVEQIKLIANVIFIGAIIWAAIRTVISFAGGSPTAMRNVMYTIIIALFWFGFNYFVDDIANSLGGSGADQYTGQ